MKYIYLNNGIEEEALLERWAWGVVYKDDSELRQFGDDGMFHQFREIDQDRVKMFVMFRPDDMTKRIDIPVVEGMQIFHFYRHFIFVAGTPDEHRTKIYVFGWKDRNNGALSYNYILPDDRLLMANRDVLDMTKYAV